MVRSVNAAIAYAMNSAQAGRFIGVGKCLLNVRTAYQIPAAGDVDGDGDADAVDGRKTATVRPFDLARTNRGGFVWWSGGAHGYGHVAIPTGDGACWTPGSPDRPGYWDRMDLDELTRRWGLTPAAWSPDFNGVTVWTAPPRPPAPTPNLTHAVEDLERAAAANRKRPGRLAKITAALKLIRPMRRP